MSNYEYPNQRRRRSSRVSHRSHDSASPTISEKPSVVTLVEVPLQHQIEAALSTSFTAIHSHSVAEALRILDEASAKAVVLSPLIVRGTSLNDLAQVGLKSPSVVAVAVSRDGSSAANQALLDLGACGVRRTVDVTSREGWNQLRALVAEAADATIIKILEEVFQVLREPSIGSYRFFELLIRSAPRVSSATILASNLRALPSTLTSRFGRAGLPSPKRYLAEVRLVYAMSLLDCPGLSIANVANRMEYSSPQSFGRHIRTTRGMTAERFRSSQSFASLLDQFIEELVRPHAATFRWFDPFGMSPRKPSALSA